MTLRRGTVADMLGKLIDMSGVLAGVFLVLMMLVTVVDVLGRYLLNTPLPGGFEMTQFLLAAIVYAGLPQVSRRGGHIKIDLLDPVTPKEVVPFRDLFIELICTAAFTILSWRLFVLAGQSWEWGDVTQYLGWPLAPIIFFSSALSAVAAIIHAGRMVSVLTSAFITPSDKKQ